MHKKRNIALACYPLAPPLFVPLGTKTLGHSTTIGYFLKLFLGSLDYFNKVSNFMEKRFFRLSSLLAQVLIPNV